MALQLALASPCELAPASLSKWGPSCLQREDFAVPFPPESFQPHSGKKEVPTLSTKARGCTVGSKPRAHAMEFVAGPKWERSMGAWLWGHLLCIPLCPLHLGTPRRQGPSPLLSPSLVNPCTPLSSQVSRTPPRGCELLVCGINSAGGGVAPKASGPLLWVPQVPSVKPNTPPNCPAGHLTPSWGPLRAQAVSCLGLGNPLKSRPPSPSLPNAY